MSRQIAIGALWMLLSKVFERVISIFSTLILARLLAPGDFGIVAMGTSVVALIELFKAFGLESALIQRQDATPEHYHTAWTLNVLAGIVIGAVIAAAAIPASHFYREPHLAIVMVVLGISAVMQGCENVGVVDFRKKLEFNRDFWYSFIQKVLGFAIVMPLAFALRNYQALVFGILGTRLMVLIYSYIAHPFRPRFSLSKFRDLFSFSKWVIPMNMLQFMKERSGDFILGRTSGARSLGVFSIASQLAAMPSTELVAPINRALLPAYAMLKEDKPALARQYVATMAVIAMLALPAIVGLAATSPLVVAVLLGDKWLDAPQLLSIMAFVGVTQILQSNAYAALVALGRLAPIVWINLIHVSVLVGALFWLTPDYGALGAAWAFVIAATIALPINVSLIVQIIGLRVRELLAAIWRPALASAIMYGVLTAYIARHPVVTHNSIEALGHLLVQVVLGFAIYVALVFTFWLLSAKPPGPERWIVGRVQRFLKR